MINLDKLRFYKKLNGDSDAWARMPRASNFAGMTDQDWYLIDRILQSLTITEHGLATPEFAEEMHRKLNDLAEGDEVRAMLIEMAKTRSIQ
jgi:hypothetical protein